VIYLHLRNAFSKSKSIDSSLIYVKYVCDQLIWFKLCCIVYNHYKSFEVICPIWYGTKLWWLYVFIVMV